MHARERGEQLRCDACESAAEQTLVSPGMSDCVENFIILLLWHIRTCLKLLLSVVIRYSTATGTNEGFECTSAVSAVALLQYVYRMP